MEYLRLRFAPGTPDTLVRRVLRRTVGRLIPKANPDFEEKYFEVVEWWLETGDDNLVTREIGFDAAGIPIVAAPLGVNWGVFIDEERPPVRAQELERTSIEPVVFEQAWARMESGWTAGWRRPDT